MPLAHKAVLVAMALVPLAIWHLVVLWWVLTAGSIVGLAAALVAGSVCLLLWARPKRLAILLVSGLVLLQTALVVLAVSPLNLRVVLRNYRGAHGKISTLAARLFIYESSFRLFLADPFTGVGPSQFDKRYMAVRSPYERVETANAHNWLLHMAAEQGVLGVLGVLIAVGGSGWVIVRALARPPDEDRRPVWPALLPAILVVLACWCMVAFDLPRSWWARVLPYPVAVSLVAAALVSLCRLCGRTGQVILLAGQVGFLVHCTAEVTPSVSGVMWPFWALVALAMAWNGLAASMTETPPNRRISRAAPILAGVAALAVIALTVRPVRSA